MLLKLVIRYIHNYPLKNEIEYIVTIVLIGKPYELEQYSVAMKNEETRLTEQMNATSNYPQKAVIIHSSFLTAYLFFNRMNFKQLHLNSLVISSVEEGFLSYISTLLITICISKQ